MTFETLSHDIVSVLAVSAWLATLVFIGRFGLTKWWLRSAGLLMMSFIVTTFMVLTLVVLVQVFGQDFPGRSVARMLVYGSANVLLWRCVILLFRDQHRGEARQKDDEHVQK